MVSRVPLFAYGTLQEPLVLIELIGRAPLKRSGTVGGWRTAALPGRSYPGLVRAAHGIVRGELMVDLSDEDLYILDAFEDPTYELCWLNVRTESGFQRGITYTWPGEVLDRDWSMDGWLPELKAYVDRVAAWRSGRLRPTRASNRLATALADR